MPQKFLERAIEGVDVARIDAFVHGRSSGETIARTFTTNVLVSPFHELDDGVKPEACKLIEQLSFEWLSMHMDGWKHAKWYLDSKWKIPENFPQYAHYLDMIRDAFDEGAISTIHEFLYAASGQKCSASGYWKSLKHFYNDVKDGKVDLVTSARILETATKPTLPTFNESIRAVDKQLWNLLTQGEVREAIVFYAREAGISRREAKDQIEYWVKQFGDEAAYELGPSGTLRLRPSPLPPQSPYKHAKKWYR